MGICTEQYRLAIGYFNRCKFVTSGFSLGFRCLTINLLFVLFILLLLNLLSGDVELNPGPVSKKTKNVRICHVNIRSLSRSKLLAIKTSLCELYDIITISESHLHAGIPNSLFSLVNFHEIIRNDRGNQGGGVAMFIRDSIPYKRIFKYDKPELETLWVQINTIEGKLLICCCYRPPDKSVFWSDFTNVLDDVKSDINNILILGDLNADLPTFNGKKLKQMCFSQNMSFLIDEPTRITKNTATILDQVVTNVPNFVTKIEVSPPVSTNDHCTVGVHLNFRINREPSYKRTVWRYTDANFDIFRQTLQDTNFHINETDDIDEACKNWTETFLKVAHEKIPNKVVTIRPNDSPWYTSDLRTLKRKMLRCFHKHKKSKMEKDWESYKNLRNEYQKGMDVAEQNYKHKLSASLLSERNTKKWWQTVKWLMGRGGDTSYPSLQINGKSVTMNEDKAQAFNNFFLSHSNIDDANAQLPDDNNFPEGLDDITATEKEVYDLIKIIDPSKATGPDGISPKLLREADIAIVPSLTKLINKSLSSATVPSNWKLANVIPLFKNGEKQDTNNYRPVSLLSCVSKILERIVFKHLFNYLREINFLSSHQSGFQPGDSTVNQLSYLYHKFAEALDNKKDVHIVFCDISKAFDRVWHEGLLYKLQKAGICGKLLKWFKNYLSDRYQQVLIRGQKSEIGLIKAGVPQGSVLGPLLFLIYINDLTNITQCNIKLFADDTCLYIEFDNPAVASESVNKDLENIQNWADQWLVKFSPPKTKLMTCSFKQTNATDIKFNNVQLESVKNQKHLGLILSHDLSWKNHIENIIQNVSPLINVLKKLKYDLDRKSLETSYFSFIRPKMEYGCQIWDNCSKRDSDLLENIQLDMARVVTGARKGTSHQLLYDETNWQSLADRRIAIKFKNFLKIINNEAPTYLQTLIPNSVATIRPNSRYADNLLNIKTRTKTFDSSFIPSSVKIWNECGPEERSISSVTTSMKKKSIELYQIGKRRENINHAQLRLKCSKLNAHLFSLHVIDSPGCICGHDIEDSDHFLLHCPLYLNIRQRMFQKLNSLVGIQDMNVKTLLYGCENYVSQINVKIFEAVHLFLFESNRL